MTSTAPKLNRDLLSDQIYSQIRDQIVSGELSPGDRVVEFDLSRSLGVSQAPVREAVKRLAHEGLLIHVPRRGSYVAEVRPEEADAARQVRTVVEEIAARAVAAHPEPETIAALRARVEEMRAAAAAHDIGAFRDADIAFHREVCEASGNGFVTRLWTLMEPSLRMWRVVSDPLFTGDWTRMALAHSPMVDAVEAGDADAAGRLFAAHAHGRGADSAL
ncbi:GntR family transcriptional regulator [Protaetiibacter mangrovi]|uniref:GntR family transcriptional regulator n=1 Tax=Protaetiibacter mangrovi TaxID=2970926 RepID=A0ABT1ZH95_9MICO|nr:GntR family transcriptional regulator [Protaetiibacter mangrovi]MCS0500089.1 GntR family transcriptional regulator [Protaetiibacter mangrovi]TPX04507.1 GntR family transcriptional regulator [Schumannella luteola]